MDAQELNIPRNVPHKFTIFDHWLNNASIVIAAIQEMRRNASTAFVTRHYNAHMGAAPKGKGGTTLLTYRSRCRAVPVHQESNSTKYATIKVDDTLCFIATGPRHHDAPAHGGRPACGHDV